MFAWFQRLLPQRGDFFGMFEAHAATLVGAAEALHKLAEDGASPQQLLEQIRQHEHRADEIIRDVLTAVRKTFLTPFDRGAITGLIVAMDDAIDEMLAAARSIDLYELRQLRPEMKQIVSLIMEAAVVTAQAIPLLRNVSANGARLHQMTGRMVALEGEADEIHAAGLKRAFQEVQTIGPLNFAVAREVFRNLEHVADAFEDVANQIDGIVIDHA
jgi:predicted phosphate transport protein (TIGR00153 family)